MYIELDENLHMSDLDASERYPSNYIIIRMDNIDSSMGTVIGIGETLEETHAALRDLENPAYCGILEGINLQCSLGGVVVANG